MKIALLGGTFDPPHSGHRKLCEHFIEMIDFDKIFVIPTFIPPHKSSDGIADSNDRLTMCALAFEGIERVEISTMEIDRGGKSYSYDTLCELKRIYPESELFFLMGTDMFETFDKWYRYEDILHLCKLCVCRRYEKDKDHALVNNFPGRVIFSDAEPFEVSSTQIREMISAGEDVSGLIGREVLEYIKTRKLYSK